jgi:DNA-binding Xre family transcriptional regulator
LVKAYLASFQREYNTILSCVKPLDSQPRSVQHIAIKMMLREIVAKNVRAIRLTRGLRQLDIADLTGLPRTYIIQLEKGEVNITVDTLERISAGLRVNPSVLLIEDAFKQPKKRIPMSDI